MTGAGVARAVLALLLTATTTALGVIGVTRLMRTADSKAIFCTARWRSSALSSSTASAGPSAFDWNPNRPAAAPDPVSVVPTTRITNPSATQSFLLQNTSAPSRAARSVGRRSYPVETLGASKIIRSTASGVGGKGR